MALYDLNGQAQEVVNYYVEVIINVLDYRHQLGTLYRLNIKLNIITTIDISSNYNNHDVITRRIPSNINAERKASL